jgi:hypothetical protein
LLNFSRQVLEQVERFDAQMNEDGHTGLFAHKTDGAVLPVNILAPQIGDVALARAQMPAQLIKCLPFGIRLSGNDFPMLLKRDCTFFLEVNRRPLPFGEPGLQ